MTDAPNSRKPSATNHDSDSRLHRRGYKDDANVRATAKPIPDVPPTITTRLPCNLLVKKFVGIAGQYSGVNMDRCLGIIYDLGDYPWPSCMNY